MTALSAATPSSDIKYNLLLTAKSGKCPAFSEQDTEGSRSSSTVLNTGMWAPTPQSFTLRSA